MYEVNSYYQKDYKIVEKTETIYKNNNTLVLNIESEVKECKCPECGEICKTSYTGRYKRCIEDVPYNFMSIWLHIHAHKFECLNPNCKKRDFDSKQYIENAKSRLEKKNLIIKVRNDAKGKSPSEYVEVAKSNGVCLKSLKKYINMDEDEVENYDKFRGYKKGKTKMDNYMNIIFKMLKDKIAQEYIFMYVKSKGYVGSDRYLLDYINLVAKNNGFDYKNRTTYIKEVYPNDITVITRYELLKYLLTLDEKKNKNSDIEKNIELIFQKYPIAKEIQILFKDFHYIMFSANPNNLDLFLDIYSDLIPSFCSGIKKDIAPVKNAISYEINSGFVEGNNNKFKLIKRIVYGKMNLVNLFKKCYLGFMSTLDNFDISMIVENVLQS